MSKIISSASKIVFILMALGTIVMTALGTVEAKDFIMLTGMAFTFYFSNKPTDANGVITK